MIRFDELYIIDVPYIFSGVECKFQMDENSTSELFKRLVPFYREPAFKVSSFYK